MSLALLIFLHHIQKWIMPILFVSQMQDWKEKKNRMGVKCWYSRLELTLHVPGTFWLLSRFCLAKDIEPPQGLSFLISCNSALTKETWIRQYESFKGYLLSPFNVSDTLVGTRGGVSMNKTMTPAFKELTFQPVLSVYYKSVEYYYKSTVGTILFAANNSSFLLFLCVCICTCVYVFMYNIFSISPKYKNL